MISGISKLADVVGSTLGPDGKHVFAEHPMAKIPISTKDGVSVATWVAFEDRFENMGAGIVRFAASQTAVEAGDGTTTTTLLSDYLIQKGVNAINNGTNARKLCSGMKKAADAAIDDIKSKAKTIENTNDLVEQVAMVSSNHDEELAKTIADVVKKIGKDGVINIQKAVGAEFGLTYMEGMFVDTTYAIPEFINTNRNEVELKNVAIVICDYDISSVKEVGKVIHAIEMHSNSRGLSGGISRDPNNIDGSFKKVDGILFMARNMDGEALASLAKTKVERDRPYAVAKAPFGGDMKDVMQDIASFTGGKVISEDAGKSMQEASPHEYCGWAKNVKIMRDGMVIIGGDGSKKSVESRINSIQTEADAENKNNRKERLLERIARIKNQVAKLQIGGDNEAKMQERADRADDTKRAVKSALEEGVVVGGGISLLRAKKAVEKAIAKMDKEEEIGARIFMDSLNTPIRRMMFNSGVGDEEYGAIIGQIINSKNDNVGYNAIRREVTDLMKDGIIDPVKVLRCSIKNSTGIAEQLLNTGAALYFLD